MRLVAYTDSRGLGGAEIVLGHLLAALAPGISVTVLGCDAAVVEHVCGRRPGAQARVLPTPRHPVALAALRPDIVHVNLSTPWACAAGLAGALALPRTRTLAVQNLALRTTSLPLLMRTRALAVRLDAHVGVGDVTCRRVEDFYALGRNSLRSVLNGVPDEPPETCPSARPRGAGFVVGSVGRLDAMKGYDVLLRAVVHVPQARVVLVGEGGARAALEQLARDLGVADRLELAGWSATPRRRLRDFDVFCLPSRTESFPLVLIEAMQAGLPVVATRVGNVAALVGDAGVVIEKDDTAGLAAALTSLRDEPGQRARLATAARARAARYTSDRMARAYERIYDEILAAPRRPRLRAAAQRP